MIIKDSKWAKEAPRQSRFDMDSIVTTDVGEPFLASGFSEERMAVVLTVEFISDRNLT